MIAAHGTRLARVAALAFAVASLDAHAVTCSVSTAGLAFGAYDVLASAPLTSTVTVRVTCTLQSSDPSVVAVASILSVSPGIGAGYAQRQMASGTNRMNYNLYTTNAYATVWGNGSAGTGVLGTAFQLNRGNPTRFRDLTGYGRVPALQDAAAGDYADNLVVGVDF